VLQILFTKLSFIIATTTWQTVHFFKLGDAFIIQIKCMFLNDFV